MTWLYRFITTLYVLWLLMSENWWQGFDLCWFSSWWIRKGWVLWWV